MTEKKLLPHHSENWNGYTLEELRYQRALNMARLEIEKEKLTDALDAMRRGMPLGGNGRGLLSKIAGSLSYVDYALLAFKVFRTFSKLFRTRRKMHC